MMPCASCFVHWPPVLLPGLRAVAWLALRRVDSPLPLSGHQDVLSRLFFGKEAALLTADEKHLIANIATLARAEVGGAVSGGMGAASGGSAARTEVENNSLSPDQSLTFDKELSNCRKSGGDCQAVIEKWKQISDKQSTETEQKLKDNPLEAQVVDKEIAQGGYDMADRPGWLSGVGADVMTSEEAKAYVHQWNGQDLAKIDQSSPAWTKFAAFVSDPENQAALASFANTGKDVIQLAKAAITSQFYPVTIKSLQVGLRNPDNVDKRKKDMLNGDFKFSAPKGKIAGYIDSQGRSYITEGNH